MKPYVFPYKMGSASAKALAQELGCLRVYPDRKYKPRGNHLIINWGNSKWPHWYFGNRGTLLNKPPFIEQAANKFLAFRTLLDKGVSIPRATAYPEIAYQWDTPVMVRQTVTGHSGQGCVYVPREDRELLTGSLAGAPLYVEYIKKVKEIRVHVCRKDTMLGKVLVPIDYAEKKVREGSEGNNFQVRSHDNGWVFCREGVIPSPRAQVLAVEAVDALGLDFGAVDIVYNEHRNEYFVLEVNTAPGLQGTTLINYANAFRSLLSC